MTMVTLSPEEIRLAEWVAKRRDEADKRLGVVDRLCTTRNAIENGKMGFAAELAVAKALNVFPDLNTNPCVMRDYDLLVVYNGNPIRIDVKYTTRPRVSIPERSRPCDVYVVVDGALPNLRIVGLVWSRQAKQAMYWNPNAPRPCWQVPKEDLVPIRTMRVE